MIDIQKYKQFENVDKNVLAMAFVQMEAENIYLKKEIDRLRIENQKMFFQLTKIQLPDVKPESQPQQQRPLQQPQQQARPVPPQQQRPPQQQQQQRPQQQQVRMPPTQGVPPLQPQR